MTIEELRKNLAEAYQKETKNDVRQILNGAIIAYENNDLQMARNEAQRAAYKITEMMVEDED